MHVKIHENYIKRCIEIAKNGLGTTRPNPMVGCVIVYNHKIIGEGYTSPYGGHHAEVNAINSVKNKELLKEATLYVTLEPCNHYGKTPPCSQLIIKHQIPNVVIGTRDHHEVVDGKGIEAIKNAGCDVIVGILEDECKNHHKRFLTFHSKKRPYIILKWAETVDGFIAPLNKHENKPVWISNEFSRQLTHKWRAEEHAILVGVNTIISDNPSLTVRDWTGQNPIRIVVDKHNSLSKNYNIFNNEAKTICFSPNNMDNIAKQIADFLYQKNIQSVIIEGGTKTLQYFIGEGIWDEARVFKGNTILFKDGLQAPLFNYNPKNQQSISTDTLSYYYND